MTENIFDVIIGRGVLKWDAVWRVLGWLADPAEGHGLGSTFCDCFTAYCFGESTPSLEIKIEYKVGMLDTGEGKWVDMLLAYPSMSSPKYLTLIDDISLKSPNDRRKLENLRIYADMASQKFAEATRSIVAVTDAREATRFAKLNYAMEELSHTRFRLLPLHTIGTWIHESSNQGTPIVQAFSHWARGL